MNSLRKVIMMAHQHQQHQQQDETSKYFAIEALEDGLSVSTKNSINYSLDGTDWFAGVSTPSINAGQKIYFKGHNVFGNHKFTITKKCNLSGNIMSLLYGDEAELHTSLANNNACFSESFSGCSTIIDASQLRLPADTLCPQCYQYMFENCTSLVAAPSVLPATMLAKECYKNMFIGCSSLKSAPEILATTLAEGCCMNMFNKCISLEAAPELPATELSKQCYIGMFNYCSSLKYVQSILPAKKVEEKCYRYMFANCTALETAPELPAASLDVTCYDYMFSGSSKLKFIKALFTEAPSSSRMPNWVSGVSSSGVFVISDFTNFNPDSYRGINGIPSGWQVYTESQWNNINKELV